jgi:hypothetical protein
MNATPGLLLILVLLSACPAPNGFCQTMNGFDLSGAVIPLKDIVSGGPPRDGIPSINNPKFVPASKAAFLEDDDIVIGLVKEGRGRAYPQRILIWHEVVNDTFEGRPVAVTYCPLCGTAMVFDREIAGKVRTFGVSGLLYQSDVLMYDHESESLWSQLAMEAVSGMQAGTRLKWLPSEHMTWAAWRRKYPEGEVLSTDTGYRRNYGGNAYAAYSASEEALFPVSKTRNELPGKEWVIGVVINGEAKAYPANELPPDREFTDLLGGRTISIRYSPDSRYPIVKAPSGEVIPSVMAFWFAWQAFYPDTDLWRP